MQIKTLNLENLIRFVEEENFSEVYYTTTSLRDQISRKLLDAHFRGVSSSSKIGNKEITFKTKNFNGNDIREIYSKKHGCHYDGNPLHLAILIGNVPIIRMLSEVLSFNPENSFYVENSKNRDDVRNFLEIQ